ncbi:hypothetical protein EPO34_03305 [Patescibacteria group bacterium]|nr:MAG: hypothetical protein EPO34_03305 [Patescibacteria group bacterium]
MNDIATTFVILFVAALAGCSTPVSLEGFFHPTNTKVVIEDFEPEYQSKVDEKTGQVVKAPVPDRCAEHERIDDGKGNVTAGKCLKWLIAGKQRTVTTDAVGAQDAALLARTENEHESVHRLGANGAYGGGLCSDPIDCALLGAATAPPQVISPGTAATSAPADLKKTVDEHGAAIKELDSDVDALTKMVGDDD